MNPIIYELIFFSSMAALNTFENTYYTYLEDIVQKYLEIV